VLPRSFLRIDEEISGLTPVAICEKVLSMSDERPNRLGDYIRQYARPRRKNATDEEKARNTLTEIGKLSGLGTRKLDHKLAGRANWKDEEVIAVARAIGGDEAHMLWLRAKDGHARGKPGNPRGWSLVHAARKKDSANREKTVDTAIQP
jgi:hypothetical protein